MRIVTLILLICHGFYFVAGQVTFINVTSIYSPNLTFKSGTAGACSDLNGDGLDDFIILDKAKRLFFGYNMGPETTMNWVEGPNTSATYSYNLNIADLENDGTMEVLTSGLYDETKVYIPSTNGQYKYSYRVPHFIYAQASNVVDINNDGYLDLFTCADEGSNMIAVRDSTNKLVIDTTFADWNTIPYSDRSGNYSSEWADVDNDGDLDLFIAKCKAGVVDPTDPRRINRLMINNNGFFDDEALERGVANGLQSWTGNLCDIDNDFDLDIIVTNHDSAHQLMINDGRGYFTDGKLSAQKVENFAFQSAGFDFNNDGWIDILITGGGTDYLLLNDQNGSFDVQANPFGDNTISSFWVGDVNDDGRMDVMTSSTVNLSFPGPVEDRIYANTSNAGNYVKVSLIGDTSNKNGIGATVRVYAGSTKQCRTVKGGEGYGVQHTFTQHFGLGQQTVIDSIVVIWPSGTVTIQYNVNSNQTIYIDESQCVLPRIEIAPERLALCDSSIAISAPLGYSSYLWSNGDTSRELLVTSPGVYLVTLVDSNDCVTISEAVSVYSGIAVGELIADTSYTQCKGKDLQIMSGLNAYSYLWSNGDTSSMTVFAEAGKISLQILDHCGNIKVDEALLTFLDPSNIVITQDTVPLSGTATLSVAGNQVAWYTTLSSPSPFWTKDTLVLPNITQSNTYYFTNTVRQSNNEVTGGRSFNLTDIHPQDINENQRLMIRVAEDATLDSVSIFARKAGVRRIILTNTFDDIIDSKIIFIAEGIGRYALGFDLYTNFSGFLTTDTSFNRMVTGSIDPGFGFVLVDPTMTYPLANIGEISTVFGRYAYFFDFTLSYDFTVCTSDRLPIKVWLDKDVSMIYENFESVAIYPNPAGELLHVDDNSWHFVRIMDAYGNVVLQNHLLSRSFDIAKLCGGLYFVALEKNNQTILRKFIKQ